MYHLNNYRVLLLFTLVSSLFWACKKDSDSTVTPNIVGKWQQKAFQYRIVYEVSASKYDKTGTRTTQGSTVEFKGDGTATERGNTYTLSGDQLTLAGNENLIAGLSDTNKLKEAKG